MHRLSPLLLLLACLIALVSAETWTDPTNPLPRVYLPAPAHLRKRQSGQALHLQVNWVGSPPAQVIQDAVETAFTILENTFTFTENVSVNFAFAQQGWNPSGSNLLGACSPGQFLPCPPSASDTKLYASALYKQLFPTAPAYVYDPACGRGSTGNVFDIWATFNSQAPYSYAGMPGPDEYDFVYVLLHEMLHGLGFSGGVAKPGNNVINSFASWAPGARVAAAYDFLMVDANGASPAQKWVNDNEAGAFQNAVNTAQIFLKTSHADAASTRAFNPKPYQPGSSWYHLDTSFIGTADQLMTPSLGAGSLIHTPGVRTLRIMQEMGWGLQPDAISTAQQASTLTGQYSVTTTTATASSIVVAPLSLFIFFMLVLLNFIFYA